MSTPLVVGFDLDMTLVDARAGIVATYQALAAQTGVHIDAEAAVTRLGPPLSVELARWFPPARVEDAVREYRALYGEYANHRCRAMPGAAAAVVAVRGHRGRVVVVTSKLGRFARAHLDHLGLAVDEVAGDRFGDGKVDALTGFRAGVYVGDHVADVRAGRAAGATAVGVATGPCSGAELAAAGADSVLADLTGFPAWLDAQLGEPITARDAGTGSG